MAAGAPRPDRDTDFRFADDDGPSPLRLCGCGCGTHHPTCMCDMCLIGRAMPRRSNVPEPFDREAPGYGLALRIAWAVVKRQHETEDIALADAIALMILGR